MSEDNPSSSPLMGKIEHLEELVRSIKSIAVTSNYNEDHIASAILEEHKNISNQLLDMKVSSEKRGYTVGERLMSLLNDIEVTSFDNDAEAPSAVPNDTQWNLFHNQLKAIEGTGEYFQNCCLVPVKGRQYSITHNSSIVDEVCRRNPPVEVVRTLLALLPSTEPKHCSPFGIRPIPLFNRSGHCALHKAIQHGGSIEVVKLLVNADHKKETLKVARVNGNQKDSAYHMLIANRNKYQPEAFSEILRYLCCIGIGTDRSVLLKKVADTHEMKIPLLLLEQSLIKEGLTGQHITRNNDYIFLLKATCYSHRSYSLNEILPQINDHHLIRQEIEAISLSEAFLVCAPCFGEKIGDKVLNDLLSVDCQFLFEKDSHGHYPMHRMITEESYFLDTATTRPWAGGFLGCILKIVLKHAPRSAQLVNDEGRLPLHIVSDSKERNFKDSDRLDLVSIIWNAYPEAAETVDSNTGLPPFALAARQEEGGPKNENHSSIREAFLNNDHRRAEALQKFSRAVGSGTEESISSSFFLLSRHPGILSDYIEHGEDVRSKEDTCEAETKNGNSINE